MMILNDNKNRIIAYIALASVCWLLINNIFYLHYHQLDSGKFVIHAHPFDKSAEKTDSEDKHKHSCKELMFINFINNILISMLLIVSFLLFFSRIVTRIYTSFSISFLEIFLSNIKARPPPAYFF